MSHKTYSDLSSPLDADNDDEAKEKCSPLVQKEEEGTHPEPEMGISALNGIGANLNPATKEETCEGKLNFIMICFSHYCINFRK